MKATPPAPRRRALSLVVTACLAVTAVAGLTQGLQACSKPAAKKADESRPLTPADAQKLAGMRQHNYADGRSGLHGTLGNPGHEISFAGWVDWQRPLLYLATASTRGGGPTVLIQAVPGVVAYRIGAPPGAAPSPTAGLRTGGGGGSAGTPRPVVTTTPPADPALPPPIPPDDNWRVRTFGVLIDGKPDPVDGLIGLILGLTSPTPDRSDLLQATQSRRLRADTYLGTPVDVLVGPAAIPTKPWTTPTPTATGTPGTGPTAAATPSALLPLERRHLAGPSRAAATTGPSPSASPSASPPAPDSLAAHGGAVAYWVDGDGRLRKLEALITADLLVRVDLKRDERPEVVAAGVLGGEVIKPRALTSAEASALARMRQRNLTARGGRLTITMPVGNGGLITAEGWLDWRAGIAYLLARDADEPAQSVLMRANSTSISLRRSPGLQRLPLPAPRGGWESTNWSDLGTRVRVTDVDVLLHEALSLAVPGRDDPKTFAAAAHRLRLDWVGDVPVAVFEIPGPADVGRPTGYARLRYWVDARGVVHRIEIRTGVGGLGRLDLDPSRTPPALPRRLT